VHALIEATAGANASRVAAQFGPTMLTYAELDARVNRLANYLLGKIGPAAPPGRRIGVSVERSLEMLVALLAVLKAGCAYVPLDPMHPAARLRHILGEAEVAALISDGSENSALVPAGTPVIDVRQDAAAVAAASTAPPPALAGADDLAYVIYTSGSTGLPKGVEISHRAVVNLLCSMAREPGLGADDVLVAVTTISFDIAALELYLPLAVGGRVVIAEREALADGFRLVNLLQSAGATAMQATPASWRLMLDAGFRARRGFRMLCGGEALPRELADRLLEGDGELWNMYGPTETTIWSSCSRIERSSGAISVGCPIANTQFYVLDRNDQPVPAGVPGQLHIGGDGVARGYFGRPELSGEKFVPNPFASGRMYRTGDLACWDRDGSLRILGRMDHQVKLRGFRIELGEIEAVLTARATLSAAAVILREDKPGAPRLVAYYVERPGQHHSADELRALLGEEIPDYMVPSAFVELAKLPLSPNGKLDRTALPVPDTAQLVAQEFVPAETATEKALVEIFAQVMQLDRVGRTADILKLGADSIQLFQITARANRAGMSLTAKQLLQHRTAQALAALLDAGTAAEPGSAKTAVPSLAAFARKRRDLTGARQ
jgi:amino acid adenylation domain-containing protein